MINNTDSKGNTGVTASGRSGVAQPWTATLPAAAAALRTALNKQSQRCVTPPRDYPFEHLKHAVAVIYKCEMTSIEMSHYLFPSFTPPPSPWPSPSPKGRKPIGPSKEKRTAPPVYLPCCSPKKYFSRWIHRLAHGFKKTERFGPYSLTA